MLEAVPSCDLFEEVEVRISNFSVREGRDRRVSRP